MATDDTNGSANVIKCHIGLGGKWQKVPSRFSDMLGYSEEELKSRTFTDITHPEDRNKSDELTRRLLDGEIREFEVKKRFLTKSGDPVWVYVNGALIKNDEGDPEYLVCFIQNLSEQRETKKRLEESEQRFRSLFQHNPHPVYCFDLEGNFEMVNDKLVEFTGYSREELLKMNFEPFIVEEDLERTKERFRKAASGEPGQYEIKVVVKGGVEKDIRVTKFPRYVGEEVKGVFGILQDITEQNKRKEKLQKSEKRFRSMFENNPHSVFYFDSEGTFRGANKKFEELSGFDEEELKEKTFEPFVHPDDRDRTREHFEKALAGEVQEYEITGITRDGEERQVYITNFPDMKDGERIGVFGICEDVTARKAANIKLKRSEQRFKSLFEHNPDAVYSFDVEGNFIMANEALEELTGYTIEELKEINFDPLVAPDDKERVWEKFGKAAEGEPQTYEASGIHKDGHRFQVQVTNLPIYIDGEIEGVFGIAHDITEEREAQRKLKESEERWQRLVENNPQPVQIVQDGKIVFINEVGIKFYGASSREELIGKSILDFTHPDYLERMLDRKRKLEQDQHIEPDIHKIVLLNGEERYIEAHSIPIQYKGKNAIQTVIHDITELKEKQQIIGESLKEKEVLLQEIHHRVKNNLAVISGLLELQAMSLADEATLNALRDSQLRIHSMAMIHEKLYQSDALSDIGFDKYLEELIQTISQTYDSEAKKVETNIESEPVSLEINQAIPCSLIVNEVLANCYKHAFESGEKGKIEIFLEYDEPELTIRIRDNGEGLPENFEIDKQNSLGMTLVQTLTHQLDGEFTFSSDSKQEGTNFKLCFAKNSDRT